MYQQTITLTPVPPFDFAQTLRFIGDFPPGAGEQRVQGATLTRALRVAGQTIVCRVASQGAVDAPTLTGELFAAAPIGVESVAAVHDRVAFWLGLTDDLRPFYAIAARDASFAPVIRAWYGYHQVKFLTPFENACWAVLAQRSPLAVSRLMKDRLVAQFGGACAVDGETYTAFPEPADLAGVTPPALMQTLRNARKADYLHSVIEAWQQVDEAWLRTGPYDDVERWLRGIRGFGAWSASFVLIRGLGRMERISLDDALTRAAARIYGHSFSADEFAVVAAQYGTMQGYWGHYLRVAA